MSLSPMSRKRSSSAAGFSDRAISHHSLTASTGSTPLVDVIDAIGTGRIDSGSDRDDQSTLHEDESDVGRTRSASPPLTRPPLDLIRQSNSAVVRSSVSSGTCRAPEVCYGMITDVMAAPLAKSTSKEGLTQRADPSQPWHVRFVSSIAVMVDDDSVEVGQLSVYHSEALFELKKAFQSVRYEVFLTPSNDAKSGHNASSKALCAVVNIYGDPHCKNEVGTQLDGAKLYLQEPVYINKGTLYSNPHVFTTTDEELTPRFGSQHDEMQKAFANQVVSILNETNTYGDDFDFAPDARLISSLGKHQISALHFALSREADPMTWTTPSLWERIKTSMGPQYRHSLTRVLNHSPHNECRGGLLADEMGMGKTLSMLALIIHTLTEADDFAVIPANDNATDQKPSIRATLVVTPKSTIESWNTEIQKHLKLDSDDVLVFHGANRTALTTRFRRATVVLTTYETVTRSCSSSDRCLDQNTWFRIVLDEAHNIRNVNTQTFAAVNSLDAQRRWCLTGTPIQNGLKDIFALTRFLRFDPFVAQKDIKTYITGPLSRLDEQGLVNLRSLMRVCSLRRMKHGLELPPMLLREQPVYLVEAERQQYNEVRGELLERLSEAVKKGSHGTSTVTLGGIRKLRQICCYGLEQGAAEVSGGLNTEVSNETMCGMCGVASEQMSKPTRSRFECGHSLCSTCLRAVDANRMSELAVTWNCLTCAPLDDPTVVGEDAAGMPATSVEMNGPGYQDSSNGRLTSKMAAVLNALIKMHGPSTIRTSPPTKSLVFTYWRPALSTLSTNLQIAEIPHIQISGQTPLDQRSQAIQTFQSDPTIQIALLTFGTGSVGLNLTAATHVHIVEPHWNPMVEEQAAARAHRIGQTRPVTVHRYIVKDSIEERIQGMQHRKFHMAYLAGVGEDFVRRYQRDIDAGGLAVGGAGESEARQMDDLDKVLEKWQLF